MNFSTTITVGGQPVIINVPRNTLAWGKANSIFVPLGPAHSEAWMVMTKEKVDELSTTSAMDIAWEQTSVESGTTSVSFPGWYFRKSKRLLHGGVGDPKALHLVQLVDARYIIAHTRSTDPIRTNLRSYAHDADYLTNPSAYTTWTALLTKLWTDCGLLGGFPGIPAGLPIDGVPENHWLIGLNAWRTLCSILDYLDCAVAPDPFTGQYSIVQLGEDQELAENTARLQWDGEPKGSNSDLAETVRVHFFFHYKPYGQERDTELATNLVVQGNSDVIDVATGIEGASGTKMLWDDQPWVLDETWTHTNNSDNTTRANNRSARYVTRNSIDPHHRIFSGILDSYQPGGQIKAVVWRNLNDAKTNQLGGTVTEFVTGSEYVLDYKSDSEGDGFVWFDKEVVTPENEAFGPPDFGRHTYPNYPRLPNIVQIDAAGAQAGDVVMPNANGFHRGKVKRWVANAMTWPDDPLYCWILFVDDYDNLAGQVPGIQGEYYGPARLSGVTTSGGTRLPVYLVRRGNQADDLVFFELNEEKLIPKSTSTEAKVLEFNGTVWVDSGVNINVWDDYYFNAAKTDFGFFTGEADLDRGWAKFRSPAASQEDLDNYTIIWMSGPAHVVDFTLSNASRSADAPAELLDASIDAYYLYGNDGLQATQVFFKETEFPRALVGAKGRALYNDRERRYDVVMCDQMGLHATALLTADMCGSTAAFEDFQIATFHPFSMEPSPLPTTGLNINNHCGENGDIIKLIWLEYLEEWDVYDVTKKKVEVIIGHRVTVTEGGEGQDDICTTEYQWQEVCIEKCLEPEWREADICCCDGSMYPTTTCADDATDWQTGTFYDQTGDCTCYPDTPQAISASCFSTSTCPGNTTYCLDCDPVTGLPTLEIGVGGFATLISYTPGVEIRFQLPDMGANCGGAGGTAKILILP